MNTKKILFLILVLLSTAVSMRAQTTIYVKPTSTGNGDGSTWENATDLQSALNNAQENAIILVAKGTYTPESEKSFVCPKIVRVYGNCEGTETDPPTDYDLDNIETKLEGNGSRVLYTDKAVTWTGFDISKGNATTAGGAGNGRGGGVCIYRANATLNYCIIHDNVAANADIVAIGGGIYMDGGTVINSIIKDNRCVENGVSNSRGNTGAGICLSSTHTTLSPPCLVINCLIVNNVNDIGVNSPGGGIGTTGNPTPAGTIMNCTITKNTSTYRGGGLVGGSKVNVLNCIIFGNTAGTGANPGHDLRTEGSVINSFYGNAYLSGGTYTGNIVAPTDNTDPVFANSAEGDYTLASASPALNAGNEEIYLPSYPSVDLAENPRIAGAGIDMGAYEFPEETLLDLVIGPTETKRYVPSRSTNIVLESDDNSTGQLILPEGEAVSLEGGVVKVKKIFTPASEDASMWYPMGFPFELKHVNGDFSNTEYSSLGSDYDLAVYNGEDYGDFWVKSFVDGNFSYSSSIEQGAGYILQFPSAFDGVDVTFISEANAELKNTPLSDDPEAEYNLVFNSSYTNLPVSDNERFYLYNASTNAFELAGEEDVIKPFEAYILAKNPSESRSISVTGGITGLKSTIAAMNNDPVVATRYYNLQGKEIRYPVNNEIYIVKKIHASNNTDITKILYNK
jgi:hypothetical protein